MRNQVKRYMLSLLTLAMLLSLVLPANLASAADIITGTLKDADNLSVDETWLSIQKDGAAEGSEEEFSVWVTNGQFTLPEGLAAGDYRAVKYWDESKKNFVFVNYSFTINADGTTVPSSLVLSSVAANVTGNVTLGASPVTGWLDLRTSNVSSPNQHFSTRVDELGKFEITLDEGNYIVTGFWNENTEEYTALQSSFTAPNLSLSITLPGKNVTGSLKNEDNSPLSVNGWLNVVNTETHYGFGARLKDGEFSLALEPGNYRAEGYWDETSQEYFMIGQDFIVVANTSLIKTLIVPSQNVTGTVLQENEQPVAGGYLQVRERNGNKHYGAPIKSDGTFRMSLPDNATYIVEGYWDQTSQAFIRLYDERQLGTEDANWSIQTPVANVTGTLQTDNNVNIDNVRLQFRADGNDKRFWTDAEVNEGEFRLALSDGAYVVQGYYDQATEEFVTIEQPFTVSGGTASLQIVVKSKNVTGSLIKGGEGIANAWIQIRKSGLDRWYGAQTKSDGSFSLVLDNGIYLIEGYYDHSADKFVQLNREFSVVNNSASLTIDVPQENVTGTLKDELGNLVPEAYIQLRKEGNLNSPQWFNIHVKNSVFSVYLPDGDYRVEGFWNPLLQQFMQLNQTITVSGATTINLQEPVRNVTGTVTRGDVPFGGINLQISSADRQFWTQATVKNDGTFAVALENGDYNIDGFWDGQNQQWVQLRVPFSVTNGSGHINVVIPESNLAGTVYDENGQILQGDFELHYYRIMQDGWYGGTARITDGHFSIPAQAGSYRVDSVRNLGTSEEIYFSQSFEVPSNTPLEIRLPKINVTGQVSGLDGIVSGKLYLETTNHEQYSLSVTNGQVKGSLPNGSYRITQFWSQERTVFLSKTLEVNDTGVVQLVLPGVNLRGTVKLSDGTSIGNGNIDFYWSTGENSSIGVGLQVIDGVFETTLPHGVEITARGFRDANGNYLLLGERFTLGETLSEKTFTVKLPNVNGSLKNSSGTPVPHQNIVVRNAQNDERITITTNSIGEFNAFLPDGSYTIYDSHPNSINGNPQLLNISFQVFNGELIEAESVLDIVIPTTNVNIDVKLFNGEAAQGRMDLMRKVSDNHYYGYNFNLIDGKLNAALPDGSYRLNSFTSITGDTSRLDLEFSVTGGVAQTVETTPQSLLPLTIQLKANNVYGTVTDSVYQPVNFGSLEIIKLKDELGQPVTGNQSNIHFQTNDKGQYSGNLERGTYHIRSINRQGQSMTIDEILIIEDTTEHAYLKNIVIHPINVIGTVARSNGELVNQGSIYFRNKDEPSRLLRVEINLGQYSIYLPSGTFILDGYYDGDKNMFNPINPPIEVTGGGPLQTINWPQP